MESICRVCMNVEHQLVSMFTLDKETNTIDLSETGLQFENCTGLELSAIPDSRNVCLDCEMRLKYFSEFRDRARVSHSHLLKLMSEDLAEDNDCHEKTVHLVDKVNDPLKVETIFQEDKGTIEQDTETIELEYYTEYLNAEYIAPEIDSNQSSISKSSVMEIQQSRVVEFDIPSVEEAPLIKKKSGRKKRESIKEKTIESLYRCKECSKPFHSELKFEAHLRWHQGMPQYKCETCGKTFKQFNGFKYHMNNHNNVRDFHCEQCGRSYLDANDLKIHLKTHLVIRPFICETCGRDFISNSHLKAHSESHTDQPLYECEICLAKFKTKKTLRGHKYYVHERPKTWPCNFCKREFFRPHHAYRHSKGCAMKNSIEAESENIVQVVDEQN